jgi:hypothetical protein
MSFNLFEVFKISDFDDFLFMLAVIILLDVINKYRILFLTQAEENITKTSVEN